MLNARRDELKSQWAGAGDIPYVLMEDFLEPGLCEQLADYAALEGRRSKAVQRNHQHVHRKGGSGSSAWKIMTPLQKEFFTEANSPEFCKFLGDVTGIDPIYADNELFGGGLHEIRRGGFLNIHTDFNHHPSTLKHRRLNLLVYLNPVWDDSWNGHIELWDQKISRPFLKEAPVMNRALIFETSERSFHGHPAALNTPEHISRRSLATYYYSDFPEDLRPRKNTNYQLTRQQWASLMGQIDQELKSGKGIEEIVRAHLTDFQSADIRRAHQMVEALRFDGIPVALTGQIAEEAYAGKTEDEIVAAHAGDTKPADVHKAYQSLMGLKSCKIQNEPFWELPDGTLTLEQPLEPA